MTHFKPNPDQPDRCPSMDPYDSGLQCTRGLPYLQDALPRWVRLERRAGEPEIRQSVVGGIVVTDVRAFPEEPPNAVRADVHFVVVAPTEGLPDREAFVAAVLDATGDGAFARLSAADLAGGPSYMTLGGWLGSQDLALMLIGAAELVGIAKAVTPGVLGITGPDADQMAGMGFVMLGPSSCWTDTPLRPDIKRWAVDQGLLDQINRGHVQGPVLEAYEAAHPRQEGRTA